MIINDACHPVHVKLAACSHHERTLDRKVKFRLYNVNNDVLEKVLR